MKVFIGKIIILISIFILFDFAIANLIKRIRPVDYGAFVESRIDFLEDEKDYDAILIGDSHVADAIDTRILEEKCGISAYNLGIYHATPFDNYFFLKKILSNGKKPKYLILGTNPEMFYKKPQPSKYLYSIVDDLSLNIEMNRYSEGKFDTYSLIKSGNEKYLVPTIFKKITGEKYVPTREVTSVYNGFLKFSNQTKDLNWDSFKIKDKKIYSGQIMYFCKLIELGILNNMQIVIVNPPIWKSKSDAFEDTRYFLAFNKVLEMVSEKYKLKIYNKSTRDLDANLVKEDFLNLDHLNYTGAVKTTNSFASWYNQNRK
jgi:hypothetical protein